MLEVGIYCEPQRQVFRCYSCAEREKKMWRRKLEKSFATTKNQDHNLIEELENEESDRNRIIVFHNSHYVEFSSGGAQLRARLTCYCRHHEEKTGFQFDFIFFFFCFIII